MEVFLDTADTKAIKDLMGLIQVEGVTTNPTIIAKSGKPYKEVVDSILSLLDDDQKFFMQVTATDTAGIIAQAKEISGLRKDNQYVKIPVTHEGLAAIRELAPQGVKILATAIYRPLQALMAAQNGALYLAPYVNRMCNYGDGVGAVMDLLTMLANENSPAKVVAASFKNVEQVYELATAGIQAVTVPPNVAYGMIDHPATTIAVKEFSDIWTDAYGSLDLDI